MYYFYYKLIFNIKFYWLKNIPIAKLNLKTMIDNKILDGVIYLIIVFYYKETQIL